MVLTPTSTDTISWIMAAIHDYSASSALIRDAADFRNVVPMMIHAAGTARNNRRMAGLNYLTAFTTTIIIQGTSIPILVS